MNGELYDFERIRSELEQEGHIFKTKSDSEIVVHLYEKHGLSFLEYLRGEFALNIWDGKKSRFIAARDRFGIKPIYYTVWNSTLLVASEIKAFLPMGWKAEWDMDSLVNNGATFDNRTVFKGVYKVPPAHYLVATSSGSIETRPYWDADYPDKNVKETRSVDEMVQGVHDRFVEAIRQRLVADVPIGVYLSGGIDSSCIAGIATKILREKNPDAKIAAFTISFKGSKQYDEAVIAKRTAEFCDADYRQLDLTEDDLLRAFEESVWHVEQPQINLNGVGKFLLSKFVRDEGYNVVLAGEGADEHFAGYQFFTTDYIREQDYASPHGFGNMSEADRRLRNSPENKSSAFAAYTNNVEVMIDEKEVVSRTMVNNCEAHTFLGPYFTSASKYYNQKVIEECGEPDTALTMVEACSGIARNKANKNWHPLHTSMYIENHTFLPNYLCNILGDRSEMAHSIEARTPFLDHPLCEYVNGLPPSLKMKSEEDGSINEKWILKEAVKPYITEEIYKRNKHPFVAPASKGNSETVIELVNRLVTRKNIEKLGWANYENIARDKEIFLQTADAKLFLELLIVMSYVVLSERFQVATHA